MTKAVSNREICLLRLQYYSANMGTFLKECRKWCFYQLNFYRICLLYTWNCQSLISEKSLVKALVLISQGNSEIGEHIQSNLSDLICLKHLIRTYQIFLEKRPILLNVCAIWSELPSDINTLVKALVVSQTKRNHMDLFYIYLKYHH